MNDPHDLPPPPALSEQEALDGLSLVVNEIAHDFNNILSLIFGYVEMALGEIPAGEHAHTDLQHVLGAGDRAKELVARILTVSNRTKLKRERLGVTLPLRAALKLIADRAPPGVSLQGRFEADDGFVLGNETELKQILTQLCNNGIQAVAGGTGNVEVHLYRPGTDDDILRQHPELAGSGIVVLEVRDNGCGMDRQTLTHIYDPFFTTARDAEHRRQRAGLGLTTVARIVHAMQGHIFVQSTPGKGSCFRVCLPLLADESGSTLAATGGAHGKKRVLFVDDEPAITEMASHILTQSGYKAKFFTDGNEALQYFSQHPHDFDIIVTDLKMPQISGSELATRCAAINPDIPILLTTGFSEKISLASCREWGVTTVISKPFSIGQLLATLEELTR